jgi:hypothetical protein
MIVLLTRSGAGTGILPSSPTRPVATTDLSAGALNNVFVDNDRAAFCVGDF